MFTRNQAYAARNPDLPATVFFGLAHRYPRLRTLGKVVADEDHASVFPFVVTHGVRSVLPSKK